MLRDLTASNLHSYQAVAANGSRSVTAIKCLPGCIFIYIYIYLHSTTLSSKSHSFIEKICASGNGLPRRMLSTIVVVFVEYWPAVKARVEAEPTAMLYWAFKKLCYPKVKILRCECQTKFNGEPIFHAQFFSMWLFFLFLLSMLVSILTPRRARLDLCGACACY